MSSLVKKTIAVLSMILLFAGVEIFPIWGVALPPPTELFYVADYAKVLSQDTIDHIVSQNDSLYQQTGAQIVVVTMDFLSGKDIEQYAYSLFNEWDIGSDEKDNGVLLLIVVGDEKYWAVQGKGLESSLTSGELGDLLSTYLEADFDAGQYDSAVSHTFDAIYQSLERIYGSADSPSTDSHEKSESSLSPVFVIVVIILLLAFFRGGGMGRRRRISPILFMGGRSGGFHGGFGGGSSSHSSGRSSSRSGGGGSSRGGGAGRR